METPQLLRKANVLAVDDQHANLVALDAVLGRDYNLVLANSGPEAIAILEARRDIDVILMDLQMPGMDGFEAASRIKEMKGSRDIPVIFITAVYNDDPYIKQGYKVGAVDYFSKPFDPEILKVKVGIYASFRQRADILKERERQIRASEELLEVGRKLSAVLERLAVGVIIADVEGRICQINEEVARILKCAAPLEGDAYGQILGWWDSSGKALRDDRGPLARALRGGDTTHNEIIHIRCLDGSEKAIPASASPLYDLDRKIVGAVVVIQDTTERKKIEADIEERITRFISLGVELEQSAV